MKAEFPPLKEVRKDLKIDWYRSPIVRARLVELAARSDLHGLLQAGGHLALFACTGVLSYYFFEQGMWIAFALALFAHGTVGCFFAGIATHELGHATVFKTPWLNRLFLNIFSILSWWNHREYSLSHTYHHRYTLHPQGDREVLLPKAPSLKPLFLLQLFTFNVFGGFEARGFLPFVKGTILMALGRHDSNERGQWNADAIADQPEVKRKAVNFARLILLFHAAVLAVAIVFELWLLPVLLTLFSFIGGWLRHFVGAPMHMGLRSNVPDFRLCVRTITLDPISEFLYWRMNWHIEHHMFAAVPYYNLAKLHKEVASDMPETRTLVGAWREMRETWRKQQDYPDYEHVTPLPSLSEDRSIEADPLATSIGDIAPASFK